MGGGGSNWSFEEVLSRQYNPGSKTLGKCETGYHRVGSIAQGAKDP